MPPSLAFPDVVVVEESTTTTVSAMDGSPETVVDVTVGPPESTPAAQTSSTTASTTTASTIKVASTTTVAAPSSSTAPTADGSNTSTTTATTSAASTAVTTTTTASTTPTTTARSTTTTTTSTTTTTALPSAIVLYLKNPGSGDTTAQQNKLLASDEPDDSSLPNYNTDEDGRPGSRFLPTSLGFNEFDTTRIEAFHFDFDDFDGDLGTVTMSGPTTLTVWLATDSDLDGAAATVDADIAMCLPIFLTCTSIASDSAPVTTWVQNGFQAVTFDFGSPTHTFGLGQELVVRLITTGTEPIHLGYDADPTPSRLETTLS